MNENSLSGSTESGGASPDPSDGSELKRKPEEETKQLNVEVPASLHKKLKMKSVESGREMRDLAAEALNRYLNE